jgi:hypothetical protein
MKKKTALAVLVALLTFSGYVVAQSSSSQPSPGLMPRGTAALPGMYFAGDRDTGIYRPGADGINFALGGTNAVALAGTTNRSLAISSNGGGTTTATLSLSAAGSGVMYLRATAGAADLSILNDAVAEVAAFRQNGNFLVDTSTLFVDATNNRVGVNDATPSFALDVNGNIGHNGTQAYWFKGYQTYTSGSGTYTVPAGVRAIRVRMVGGGGGGGYAIANTAAGARCSASGGQSGYFVEAWMTGLAASYSYAVGAAGGLGEPVTPTNATDGGDTTFATFTAEGGMRGGNCSLTTNVFQAAYLAADPPARAANAGATLNRFGEMPTRATDDSDEVFKSWGGPSPLEGQINYATTTVACTLGTTQSGGSSAAYGGGGGGACAWRNGANVQTNGGAGAAGVIIIEEFF